MIMIFMIIIIIMIITIHDNQCDTWEVEFEYPTTASPFTTVYLTIMITMMNMIIVKIMTIAASIIAIIMIMIAETVENPAVCAGFSQT